MNITTEKKENYILVNINESKLNSLVAPDLKTALVGAHGDGISNIIVNLENVIFADSSGLSALLIGNRLCKNVSGSFIIAAPQKSVSKLIEISQLDSILKIVGSLNEAIDLVLLEDVEKEIENED
tara:strand:+ start:96 stop:470 length:375 start_codon:yes stop_codon:yes gene_type:complete